MRRPVVSLDKAVLITIFFLISLASAAQQPQRQIIVSIPDRKLALVEDGDVVALDCPQRAADAVAVRRA